MKYPFLPLVLIAPSLLFSREWHVAINGNDASAGSSQAPFRTVYRGVESLQAGDTLTVHEGTYSLDQRHGIRIAIQGTESTRTLIRAQGAVILQDSPTDQWNTFNWDGVLKVDQSAWVMLEGFQVRNSGSMGIYVNASRHITVRRNSTYRTLLSGIGVWGSQAVIVDSNDVSAACNQGQSVRGTSCQECITIAQTDTFSVAYNTIHDNVQSENPSQHAGGGEGLDLKDGSKNGSAHHNKIFNTSQLGLYVEAWDKHMENIEIAYNEIYGNVFGIVVTIENGGSMKNVNVHDNVVYNNGYHGISLGHYQLGSPIQGLSIRNNTVVNNGRAANKIQWTVNDWSGGNASDWGYGLHINNDQITGLLVENNIFSKNASGSMSVELGSPGQVLRRNLSWPGTGFSFTNGDNAIIGDPRFVDESKFKYALQAGSPAIDVGNSWTGMPAKDFSGTNRFIGNAIDLGAFEWQGTTIINPKQTSRLNFLTVQNTNKRDLLGRHFLNSSY